MQLDRRRALALTLGAVAATLAGCSDSSSSAPTAGSARSTTPASSNTAPATTGATAAATAAPTTRPVGGPARFVARGPASSGAVALTFHTNGDLGLAQRLLDTVAGRAQVTCFVIGSWLETNPAWGRKLADAGHELANHTYSHPSFAALGRAQMADEIARCRDALTRLAGTPGRYFRPSGTDDGLSTPAPAILEEAGRAGYDTVLGWDVEPFDYQDPGRAAVQQRVLAGVSAGSIVSLHFGHTGTVEALPAILDGLAAKNLRAVTVSKLLGLGG